MAKIYVSAGHSASDSGAVKYLIERDEVWTIANFVAEELQKLGHTTYRDTWTMTMHQTVADANSKKPDLFIEFHENAGGGEGAECFIYSEDSRTLGEKIQQAFADVGQSWRRCGVWQGLYVLNSTNCRAVLVECCFVDNKRDAEKFKTDSQKRELASAVARRINEFLGGSGSGCWIQNSTGWWYKRADGSYPANEWERINGEWYYFNANGYIVTGWQHINGHWFYLKSSGAMKTGWLKDNGKWYYLDENGYMVTGWLYYNKRWYYMLDSGAMKVGWVAYKNEWYWMREEYGAMLSDAFKEVGGKLYRFNEDGKMEKKATYKTTKNGDIVKI